MNLQQVDDVIYSMNAMFSVQLNDEEALIQEYMDLCGYSREDAIKAALSAIDYIENIV